MTDYVRSGLGPLAPAARDPLEGLDLISRYRAGGFIDLDWDPRAPRYVATFRCPVTSESIQMRGDERAVVRGVLHFATRWIEIVKFHAEQHLPVRLIADAMRPYSAVLQAEAHREMALEMRPPEFFLRNPYSPSRSRAEQNRIDREREKALKTSKALLESNLSPEQLRRFREHGSFYVQPKRNIGRGGPFEITTGSAYNVVNTRDGSRYCVVCAESVPVYDQMLMQKMLLENDPERFFEIANRARGHGREYSGVWIDEVANLFP